MSSLHDRIAVVAGATRGAGRGIAAALGEAGATVICTGRSSRTGSLRSDYAGRAETIEETAEIVSSLGGRGVAKPVDHLEPTQVQQLADELRAEHGHIDILVNDIWGAEVLKGGPPEWNKPIWEVDLDKGLRTLRLAIDTHLITSHHPFFSGGFETWDIPPETDPVNFATHVRAPVLMVNGREDFDLPYTTAQLPMFHMLGTAPEQKQHVVFEGGHIPPHPNEAIKAVLDWLDVQLGPVK